LQVSPRHQRRRAGPRWDSWRRIVRLGAGRPGRSGPAARPGGQGPGDRGCS